MIPIRKAYKIIMNSAKILGSERVKISEALGRILAENISADRDLPPFNRSMRDGYALRRTDVSEELEVIEEIPAGYISAAQNRAWKMR